MTLPDLWIDIPACQHCRSFAASLHKRRRQKQRTPRTSLGSRDDSHASALVTVTLVCYCCTLPVIPTQPGATLPVPTGWQGGDGSAARLSNDGVVCERA